MRETISYPGNLLKLWFISVGEYVSREFREDTEGRKEGQAGNWIHSRRKRSNQRRNQQKQPLRKGCPQLRESPGNLE